METEPTNSFLFQEIYFRAFPFCGFHVCFLSSLLRPFISTIPKKIALPAKAVIADSARLSGMH